MLPLVFACLPSELKFSFAKTSLRFRMQAGLLQIPPYNQIRRENQGYIDFAKRITRNAVTRINYVCEYLKSRRSQQAQRSREVISGAWVPLRRTLWRQAEAVTMKELTWKVKTAYCRMAVYLGSLRSAP